MIFLRSIFRKIKSTAHVGGVDSAHHHRARAQLLSALPDAVFESAPSFSQYMVSVVQSMVYKPVAASAAALVFLAGGWMTTSAAQQSLPGETLYNVKLITERAQLQLASLDRRAVLHTEFANRRLEEVVELQHAAISESHRTQYISRTVTAYQQEIVSATEDLQVLQTQNQAQALAVASTVLDQVSLLQESLETITDNQDAVTREQEVADRVAETTEAIADVAKTVTIDVHESEPSAASQREIAQLFRDTLGACETRQAMVLHRIAKIEELLVAQKTVFAQQGVVVPSKATFLSFTHVIENTDKDIPNIMNAFAAGGYRSALGSLEEIHTTLAAIEAELAEIEHRLTQALTNAKAEEVLVEPQPAEDVISDDMNSEDEML